MKEARFGETVEALRSLAPSTPLREPSLPYAEVLQHPAEQLGPFASLPPSLRGQLLEMYEEEERIRTLAHGVLSQSLLLAGAVLGRTLYRGERWVADFEQLVSGAWAKRAEILRRSLRRAARESTHLPFMLRRWLHRTAARVRVGLGRADLPTLLRASDLDPRTLGFDYLEGMRQIRGCEAVLRCPEATYSQLLGIDFVLSGGRYWLLEANYNPALMDARLALYEAPEDPWVQSLIACALARGFRRLVVYGYRPFSPAHARALIEGGRRRGVEVSIIDDLFSVRHAGHRRAWLMERGATQGALVVRAKGFDVLFDRALLSKRQTRRIVETMVADGDGSGLALPALIPLGSPAPSYQADSRYPNVVAKVDGLDRGAGVWFYKLPTIPQSLRGQADYFEEYRVPDPCPFRIERGRRTDIPEGAGRAWKIRSYALLTPEGTEYLSSIKVISGKPVPAQLPDGKVAEKNIYLATINEGGIYSAFTPDEDDACRSAVQAVGDALLAWLRRKYPHDLARQEAGVAVA